MTFKECHCHLLAKSTNFKFELVANDENFFKIVFVITKIELDIARTKVLAICFLKKEYILNIYIYIYTQIVRTLYLFFF